MMSPQENFDDILRQKMLGASMGISGAQRQRMEAYLRRASWQSRLKRWGATAMACSFILLVQAEFLPVAKSFVAAKKTVAEMPLVTEQVVDRPVLRQLPAPAALAEAPSTSSTKRAGIVKPSIPAASGSQLPAHETLVAEAEKIPVLAQSDLPEPLMRRQAPLPIAEINIEAMPVLFSKPATVAVKKPAIKPLGFYVGAGGALNNTWIYNQNTYGAFGNTELAYAVDWGMSGGVSAGLRIKDGIWLETGYNLIAQQGQKYKDIIGNQVVYREVNLSYHQIPLLLKFENKAIAPSARLLRSTFNIGVQYGLLNSATINDNGISMSAKERFRDAEWSLVAGKSFTFSLSERLALESSIYTKLGSNINADKWMAQDSYGKSHNLTFGAQLHVLYFLGR